MFTILIPTWNNLPYLKHCVGSIKEHSALEHQILVVVNEGSDGTIDWLKAEGIEYVHHQQNVGICTGLNSATDRVKKAYIVYLNDDMYTLPGWDTALDHEIQAIGHDQFLLSGTMIEPRNTGNPCVLIADFGDDLESFKPAELLSYHQEAKKEDWSGASWPPVVLPTALWKAVGGMSEEYSPGMYSDPDLSMKLWNKGVRYFKGLGESRVYHFGSKSTRKLGKNIGRSIFLKKWRVTAGYFYRNFLHMGEPWKGPLSDFKPSAMDQLLHRLKRVKG